jgi:fluoroquinolone resistance protein
VADRKYGAPAPPTDSEIRHENWGGRDLAGLQFSAVAFVSVDLSEVQTAGAVFTECAFRDCRFNASVHEGAAFLNCTFTRCNFFDASLTGCKLVGSMFDRCSFDLLSVRGGDWSFVGLPGADLRSASFYDVRMREVDMTGTRCAGAKLNHLDLSGAWLHRSDFTGADLRGSDLPDLDPATVELAGAIVGPQQAIQIAAGLGLTIDPDEPDG